MVSNNIVDYLERIKRLYTLIKQEHTGSLSDIAKKNAIVTANHCELYI